MPVFIEAPEIRPDCRVVPAIHSTSQARQMMHLHAHWQGADCPQRREALAWLSDNGVYVLSSRFAKA